VEAELHKTPTLILPRRDQQEYVTERITTLDQLESAKDSSLVTPELREIAELFASAMQDWPTPNIEFISQFVSELSGYFGQPITKQRLKAVPFSGVNSWELESGTTLILMLEKALRLFKVDSVETALDKLLTSLEQ
jgi:hypothetical protein